MSPQNSAGEPMADRQPNQPEARHCLPCRGPCRLPDWAKDSSWYANNPGKYDIAVAHNHAWFEPARLTDVERVQAETRALVPAATFGCAVCRKFAFDRDGVACYWCGRRAAQAVAA